MTDDSHESCGHASALVSAISKFLSTLFLLLEYVYDTQSCRYRVVSVQRGNFAS